MEEELKPIHDPTEAKRKRAFFVALTLSLVLVIGGWLFALSQEVQSLVSAVPESLASPEVQEALAEWEEARAETTEVFQEEMTPVLKEMAQDIEAQAQVTAATAEIVDDMAAQIEAQTYEQQTQE